MKVEIHRENYQAYIECKAIQDTQQQILHRLSGAQFAEPTPTPASSYASSNSDRYNWCNMEQHLFAPLDAQDEDEIEEDDPSASGSDD
jgi:hypothetical protein